MFISFDWSRDWEGDSESITLSRKERAFIRSLLRNASANPDTFIVNFDEVERESVNDFIDTTIAHTVNTVIIQPESGFQDRYFFDGAFMKNMLGTSVIARSTWTNSRPSYSPVTSAPTNAVHFPGVRLRAGNYVMQLIVAAHANCAKFDIFISDFAGHSAAIWNNLDLYQPVAGVEGIYNTTFTLTDDYSGSVVFAVDGRNVNNTTGYNLHLVCAEIYRV